MKCIMCGAELTVILNDSKPNTSTIGYKCTNCKLQWTPAEHKDNQNWAVRHIRALEADNQALKEQIVGLMQQNIDLATKFEIVVSVLEKTLGVDLNNDGTIST